MKLRRRLGLSEVFSICVGAMISSGIFVLPGLAHARAGPAVVFSYLMAGLLAAIGLLSVAELTTAMPKAGGDYFFVSRGMGPAAGTVAGILTWFSLSLKAAFALVGMIVFTELVLPLDPHVVGISFCIFFVALNVIGVKEAARIQVVLVAGLLALMALYIVRGLPIVDVQRFQPLAPHGARAVFATTGFVFVSYGGLLKVASISEEVRDPGRLVPLGMVLSWTVAFLMYVLMVFVTSGVLDAGLLDHSTMPISLGAEAIMGRPGMIALSVAAILAFLTTANGGIMAASRYILALSRDGLIPEPFGRIGQRFRTPHVALILTGALVLAAIFVRLDFLVEAASAVFMMTYVLANLAVIILRESRLQNYRPQFRAPLYPWIQIAGIVGILFVIVEMGAGAFLTVTALALLGFLVYWTYGRARADRESALLHLVERITAKELATGTLEEELKAIIHERDGIREDLFDGLVKRGPVVDVDGSMLHEDFFTLASERLGPHVGAAPPELRELLLAREQETSTVLAPGLAIPHVVIPGEGTFELLMARSREGIDFPGAGAPVHAAFVLVGTLDQRNMHLRALSAIAQVVQGRDFEKRWMRARGEQALRDVLLLGERRRVHDD